MATQHCFVWSSTLTSHVTASTKSNDIRVVDITWPSLSIVFIVSQNEIGPDISFGKPVLLAGHDNYKVSKKKDRLPFGQEAAVGPYSNRIRI